MADDHGVSCSGLGVAWLFRALGLEVLGVALLLERLVLDDLFDGDFFWVKRVLCFKLRTTRTSNKKSRSN